MSPIKTFLNSLPKHNKKVWRKGTEKTPFVVAAFFFLSQFCDVLKWRSFMCIFREDGDIQNNYVLSYEKKEKRNLCSK